MLQRTARKQYINFDTKFSVKNYVIEHGGGLLPAKTGAIRSQGYKGGIFGPMTVSDWNSLRRRFQSR